MKLVFIGASGHTGEAVNAACRMEEVTVCAVAKGAPWENMDGLVEKLESRGEHPKVYVDYLEMLDVEKPKAAVVATVFGLAADISIECARRKIHVLSEKPIAPDLEKLDRLKEAVEESGIAFCAMHYLRFHNAFYTVHRAVEEGRIGNVRLINGQKSYKFGTRPEWYGDRSLYTGTIPWVGIHAIDWVLGNLPWQNLQSISAVHSAPAGDRGAEGAGSPEMTALCMYAFEGGAMASVTMDYYRPQNASTHGDDRVRIVGDRGVIEARDSRVYLINEDHNGELELLTPPDLAEAFLREAMGQEPAPLQKEEIFAINRIALLSRQAADRREMIEFNILVDKHRS